VVGSQGEIKLIVERMKQRAELQEIKRLMSDNQV
jgi:hypothetical protein